MFNRKCLKYSYIFLIIIICEFASIKNVSAIECYSCNSSETPNCVNQQLIGDNICEDETNCYSRITENGETIRGCLSEYPECLDNCYTCESEQCNNEIFPENRLKCYQCTGELCNDENFSAGPCQIYVEHAIDDETCYINVQGGVITRGCLDDIADNDMYNCTSDSTTCETCSNEACNNRLIIQDDCIFCDSAIEPGCIDSVNDDWTKQCPFTLHPIGCYTFNDGGGDVKRGCLSDIQNVNEIDFCTKTLTFCKSCEGSNCNVKYDFTECYICESGESCSISINSELYSKGICKNYYDECFVHFEDGRVTRGCVQEHLTLIENCSENNLCNTCVTNNCNNELFCIECQNCYTNETSDVVVLCNGDIITENCYRLEDNDGNIQRGCLSSLDTEQRANCIPATDNCKTCDSDICNEKMNFQSCHECNSNENYNCVTNKETIDTKMCSEYMDTCRILISDDGQTHRGCSTDLQDLPCTANNLCYTCTESDCNTNIFPIGRPTCYKCSGEDCKTISDLNIEICPIFMENDRCYTYVDGYLQTHRGCMSDQNEATEMCTLMGNSCVTCIVGEQSETICNDQISIVDPQLSCITCSSDDDECAWGYAQASTQECSELVIIPNSESCYTKTNTDGTVERGCLLDNPDACSGTNNCAICSNDSGCNNGNIVYEICIQCNSSVIGQQPCADEITTDNFAIRCTTQIQEYAERGCYKWNLGDGIIERGCASQLTEENLENCKSTTFSRCEFCDDARQCNTGRAPNSSNKIDGSIFIIILSIIMLQKLIN